MSPSNRATQRDDLLAAFVTVLGIGAAGLVAVATHQLVLFASLGPTAVMQAHSPTHRAARLYHVIVGHTIGACCAAGTVLALGLAHSPSVFSVGSVSGLRLAAAAIALGAATFVELRLRATHPPAASTTLLVALGSFHPTRHDLALILSGVVIVGLWGDLLRRAMVRSRAQTQPEE